MFALIARTGSRLLALAAMLVWSIAVTALAATPPGTVITNTAQVQWTVGPNTSTVSAQRQITVSPYTVADLAITMTGPAQVAPGAPVGWKAVVSNVGTAVADGTVSFTVPPGVTAVSGVCAVLISGTCGAVTVGAATPAGTPVTVPLNAFPPGGRVEITLRGTAPATPGTITNNVVVSLANAVDPTLPNNFASVPTRVAGGAGATGSLSGRVWLDGNHDRAFTSGERLLSGFTVRIYDAAGTTVVRTVTTDANGAYSVQNLPANVSYQIEFRDPAGNVVFGLPVTTESAGVPAGFASTTTCASLITTNASNFPLPIANGNCYSLTSGGSSAQVQRSGRIVVALQPGDNVIEQSLPLDPSGVVYDSNTRAAIPGATVTLSGPAGFDPVQHLLGGAANVNQITGSDGFYQFLLVGNAPNGSYTIRVTPPANYVSPSARIVPQAGALDPTGQGVAGVFPVQAQAGPPTGAQPTIYYLAFALERGDPNVINNHIPLDPLGGPAGTLLLRKTSTKPIAAVGDFVQYQLSLSNPGSTPVATVNVADRLPPGFRYRNGSTTINGVAAANPTISADGRTLTFSFASVAANATYEIRYVTEITAGASVGDAVNSAQARGAGGVASLVASATVKVKEDLFRGKTILIGRVIEVPHDTPKLAQAGAGTTTDARPVQSSDANLCGPEQFFGKGIENARIYMEDGTYVRTDKEGKWHIEGVKPGTHVVQLDVKSLPPGYEPVLCEDNTRHGGRAFSQFVNVRGGTLWRADFYVRKTGAGAGAFEAGHRLVVRGAEGRLKVMLELKGSTGAARNVSATIALPKGLTYLPGTVRMNGAAFAEPEVTDNLIVFRIGDASGKWAKALEFEVTGTLGAEPTLQAMSQFQSEDGETRRLPPLALSLDVRWISTLVLSSDPQIIQWNQILTKDTAKDAPKAAAKDATTDASGRAATPVAPVAAQPDVRKLNIYAPGSEKFDAVWLAQAQPGLEIVYPPRDFIPGINATKVFVKHDAAHKITVTVNGVPAPALSYDGADQVAQKQLMLSRWGGLGLKDGANKIVAAALDASGKEIGRAERTLHFSGGGVEGRFVGEASTLIADGRTTPVIAVRIYDKDGKPVRHGTDGELKISSPYQSLEVVQRRDSRPLLDDIGNQARWRVTDDGLALIKLQPTTTSGEVVLTFNFQGRQPQVIRAWLKPEMREWILVSLAEGTVGQRRVSGALENIPANLADDKLWRDGRVAFYAKGQIKGEVLVTIAYDTDKERRRFGTQDGARLLQTIDRKQYYTIYGDTTSAQHDAASVRKLYLKVERNQWYALFGDFDSGMTVTELSRYSRTLNGIKTEFRGENVSLTAFGTKTAQAFVKDELRADGTSGYYRLTRANILPNSDKVTLETRDRFRNEIVVKSEPLSRGVDYEIDYLQGTLFFRRALPGRDQSFNPIYIVADYESEDPSRDEKITAGGRVAVRTSDGKGEVGVSVVREGTTGARGDLRGVDARYQIDDKTTVRAEAAGSKREVPGAAEASGNAYLVEVQRQDANVAARAYVRGQQGGFGLGQQAAAGAGTTKAGADVSVKVTPELSINSRVLHERTDNAGATAQRSQVEARANLTKPDYNAYVGGRIVRDQTATGETLSSNQIVAGGSQKAMDGRVTLRVDAEMNVVRGDQNSVDYPDRVRVGADYKVSDKAALFMDQEFAFGGRENASTTRIGLKSKPWEGGESATAFNLTQTSDGPALSTSSSTTQTVRLTPTLTVNAGFDRSKTLMRPGNKPLNANVPSAQGVNSTLGNASQSTLAPVGIAPPPVEDYTAVFAGATWNSGPWGMTARTEYRQGTNSDRINAAASVHRDLKAGEALAATVLYTDTKGAQGENKALDLRLSYAFRPIESLWIVLSRLDYIQEQSNATGGALSRRMVSNNNINYQYNRATQIAFQYGAKYVFDSYDHLSASGFTDLMGAEVRYDVGSRFDIGAHASLLHSWGAHNFASSYGLSVGFSPLNNLWLGVGYNFAGFKDRDFTAANATAKGWYLYMRLKADQETLRDKDTSTGRQLSFEEVTR